MFAARFRVKKRKFHPPGNNDVKRGAAFGGRQLGIAPGQGGEGELAKHILLNPRPQLGKKKVIDEARRGSDQNVRMYLRP